MKDRKICGFLYTTQVLVSERNISLDHDHFILTAVFRFGFVFFWIRFRCVSNLFRFEIVSFSFWIRLIFVLNLFHCRFEFVSFSFWIRFIFVLNWFRIRFIFILSLFRFRFEFVSFSSVSNSFCLEFVSFIFTPLRDSPSASKEVVPARVVSTVFGSFLTIA